MSASTLLVSLVAGVASVFMAWSIGAGSSGSTPFAPAVGARAISIMRAAFFVGILGFMGAVSQGANVSTAVGMELISGVQISPLAAAIGLSAAAGLVAVGVFAGYPIATAFTVTGAVVGVGLALGGDPAWSKYRQIAALWLFVPVLGGGSAYLITRLLRAEPIPVKLLLASLAGFIGLIIANIEFSFLASPGSADSIAGVATVGLAVPPLLSTIIVSAAFTLGFGVTMLAALERDDERAQQRFLLGLGGLVAFSAGGSQVGLAIGPLLPMLPQMGLPLLPVLATGGVGLLIGSWTGAPRMIKALSQDYSALGPNRSIAALVPSFAIAQTAVFFGIPVSFNEIIVSGIIGSGYAAGTGEVSGRKMIYTAAAWIGSLAVAAVIGYTAYTGVQLAI